MSEPTDRGRRRAARRRARVHRRAGALAALGVLAVGSIAMAARPGEAREPIPVAVPALDAPLSGAAAPPPPPAPPPLPPPAPPPPRQSDATAPVRVAAVGDVSMGSMGYGLPPDAGAGFFAPVAAQLTDGADLTLGNLEGPLTERGTSKCPPPPKVPRGATATAPAAPTCFAFRTPPSYAGRLAEAGFDVLSLANNHANDFGAEGLADTVAALEAAGVVPTGTPGATPLRDVAGTRVAVLGFAPYPWADPLLDLPAASARVAEAASLADVVIVNVHGGAEGADARRTPAGAETYLGEDRGDVRAFAHAVVDAGADVVIGHGPHVLRGIELYEGRLIAYSLGNFAGYEVFSLRGPLAESAILRVEVGADGAFRSGRLLPTRLVGEGTPAPGGDALATVRELSRADFGDAAARIDARGVIRPPGGAGG